LDVSSWHGCYFTSARLMPSTFRTVIVLGNACWISGT
jgi:hypothetical protein